MSASFWTFYPNRMAWINQKMLAVRKWRCWCLHFAHEIHSNSRPKTQNNYKNVWICPECVITKECPETFLLFLYKTPLFPRLVQVFRICFLSLSLPPSVFPFLPLPLSLSLSPALFVETHEHHKRLVYRRATIRAQCLQGGAQSKSPLRNLQEGASRLRRELFPAESQTEDSWKQTGNTAELSELTEHIL